MDDTKDQEIRILTDLLAKAGRAYANRKEPPVEVKKWWLQNMREDRKKGNYW